MANFLTTGRQAFIALLKADATLSSTVTTWFEWAGGLRKRKAIEVMNCPLISIAPNEGDVDRNVNVIRDIPQGLQVDIADEGDDVSSVEEMLAAAIEVVDTASQTRLDLADSEGLANVEIAGISWLAMPDETGDRIIWVASMKVRLTYKRY